MSDTAAATPLSSPLGTGRLWLDVAVAGFVIFVVSRVLKYFDGLKVSVVAGQGLNLFRTSGALCVMYKLLNFAPTACRVPPGHTLSVRPAELPWWRAPVDVVEPCAGPYLAEEIRL